MSVNNRRIINLPLNRVEGDLELHLEYDDRTTTNSWSCGVTYRGFENILKGRGPLDGLVLTPRVCGICGTAHLMAAVQALDMLCDAKIPDNAVLVRHLALMAEHIQSDVRQTILMFMKDFINPLYKNKHFFAEAGDRYQPLRGTSVIKAIRETKKVLEIIAILGGHWPNSSFMVPGGIATTPSFNDLITCRYLHKTFSDYYEQQILGCSLDRWAAIRSTAHLDNWLLEKDTHRCGDLGFFMRCARQSRLHTIGESHGNYISVGMPHLPLAGDENDTPLKMVTAGFSTRGATSEFLQARITEHVAFSRFEGYGNGLHPFEGITIPCATPATPDKYSLAKAPRYDEMPAETGPLAEMLIDGDPLFTDLVHTEGPTAFVRQLARLTRPARLLPVMKKMIAAIDARAPYYLPPGDIPDGRGYGLIEASRGFLGHWLEIRNGVINRYQIITPTSWNGSPRDGNGVRGPWEEASVGIEVEDPENPVEIGHIVRSFDPCLFCAVHRVVRRS